LRPEPAAQATNRLSNLGRPIGLAVLCGLLLSLNPACAADPPALLPEPEPTPFDQRDEPYSMVVFAPPPEEAQTRALIQSIRDMGLTRSLASVHWWQMEELGGDYDAQMGYTAGLFGERMQQAFANYIRISHELGVTPSVRVGTFRSTKGLYHPMDTSGDVKNYAAWLRGFAEQHRGKIDHYIIGDELNKSFPQWGWGGTPEEYMEIFIPLAAAIHEGDPDAKVSPASTSSSPATDWIMGLIELGLPEHAEGVACHFNYRRIQDLVEITGLMTQVRSVWPEAKFFGNGFGYADNTQVHDARQAGIVAQCAFTMWEIGWDSFPYYTYRFSRTRDTYQNFGLIQFGNDDRPTVYADAWYAYQTIANTFYGKDELTRPGFPITLQAADTVATIDGVAMRIAPPDPAFHAYVRKDRQLLLYLGYRSFTEPVSGQWNVILETDEWGGPQEIPLLDHTGRLDVDHEYADGKLFIKGVSAGLQPVILTLRRVAE